MLVRVACYPYMPPDITSDNSQYNMACTVGNCHEESKVSAGKQKGADPIAIARDVLRFEGDGIAALSEALCGDLGDHFLNAVAVMQACSGRVIVTGMGKSGHIGRKIAATLSSTGQPAMFVHPGEASHGDLGTITREDVILALSKSGETGELSDLLAFAGRFSIPVISITNGLKSTLASASDVVIGLPPMPEACGETRAPTTSTTMTLAIGDALAVVLLRLKGFTSDNFQDFHPGGNLGAALRRVSDLMHAENLPLCRADLTIAEAVGVIGIGGFGCVGVTNDDGVLTGILTDGDVRRLLGRGVTSGVIGDVMTRDPITITPLTIAGEALALMNEDRITALFVIDDTRRPVGLLHVHDCLSSGVL